MAELWGSVVVSVLFWGFANEVTTSKEAKRYYPLFGLGANVALIFSGQVSNQNMRNVIGYASCFDISDNLSLSLYSYLCVLFHGKPVCCMMNPSM